jgi:hypothetical protein
MAQAAAEAAGRPYVVIQHLVDAGLLAPSVQPLALHPLALAVGNGLRMVLCCLATAFRYGTSDTVPSDSPIGSPLRAWKQCFGRLRGIPNQGPENLGPGQQPDSCMRRQDSRSVITELASRALWRGGTNQQGTSPSPCNLLL